MAESKYCLKSPPRKKVARIKEFEKDSLSDYIIAQESYQKLTSFRQQCYHLATESVRLDRRYKLTHDDIGALFNVSKNVVSYHVSMAKKEEEGKIKANGRPFILSPEEIESVRSWIDDHEIPPKIGELRLYLLNKLEKDLSYNQLGLLLDKMDYDLKIAVPMEDDRFFLR